NQILENITHPDVIIIDEIGHLELREQGFAPGLRSVLERHSCLIVLVVRESLLSDVVSCFGIRSYKPFSVTDGAFLTQLLATTDL
ncbi:nucleoside-triphosphatase, partial [Candidatus Poribacteria bacterium]